MRSLIIIEVEHGETTDDLQALADACMEIPFSDAIDFEAYITNYAVKVDLPACFVLDSENTN